MDGHRSASCSSSTRNGSHRPHGTWWTWTAIYGNPKLGTGILNNPLYIGDVIWNKFRWEKDPETGKRVPRLNPREDWIVQHDESLRVVPQELWERVKQRQRATARKSAGQRYRGGRHPKYLFSGLLKCGLCRPPTTSSATASRIQLSFHVNRGATACHNGLGVKRRLVEDRLLDEIRHRLFPARRDRVRCGPGEPFAPSQGTGEPTVPRRSASARGRAAGRAREAREHPKRHRTWVAERSDQADARPGGGAGTDPARPARSPSPPMHALQLVPRILEGSTGAPASRVGAGRRNGEGSDRQRFGRGRAAADPEGPGGAGFRGNLRGPAHIG